MKKLFGLGAALFFLAAQPSSAATIYADDFNRADSTTVGFGWVEGAGISVNSNQLLFDANDNALTVTQGDLVLSTVNYTNLVFSFDWRGISTDTEESITAYWSSNGTTFNLLAPSILLSPSASFTNQSYNLPIGA